LGRELRRRGKQRRPAPAGPPVELTLETLGAQGDGIGSWQGKPLYVAGGLPGERVRVHIVGAAGGHLRGALAAVLSPAATRRDPPCPHFGPCGGCMLQHLDSAAYAAWKRDLVVQALQHRGFAAAEELVAPLAVVPPGQRRRVSWTARRLAQGTVLGFHARGSDRIVDQQICLLLTPALQGLIAPLHELLDGLDLGREAIRLTATETDSGIDLLLDLPQAPHLDARERLAAFAAANDLARLSLSAPELPEPLAQRRAPRITLGGPTVLPPPGAFLQPSKAGEAQLQAWVMAWLSPDLEALADLYAGCGTFALPLAARGQRVLAVESQAETLAALRRASEEAGFSGRIRTERRDLERRPLEADTLKPIQGLIFDPPRAGAAAQCERLAAAGPPVVVAVSCNPATFARDARTLVGGGYRLDAVRPLDQFPWSHHLELAALFRR